MNRITENAITNAYTIYESSSVNSTKDASAALNEKIQDDTAAVLEISQAGTRASNYDYQSKLSTLGFYSGPMDGNLSSDLSVRAIKIFQKVYGITETGNLSQYAKDLLNTAHSDYYAMYNSSSMTTLSNAFSFDEIQKQTFAKVYTFLKNGMGLTTHQIAGAMGNIYAESAFAADNAQDELDNNELTDEQKYIYSAKHNPEYASEYAAGDGIAFGLIQWKYESRKEGLEDMAEALASNSSASAKALSLNNLNTQLAFFRQEVTGSYAAKWQTFKTATTYQQASYLFMTQIEETTVTPQKTAEREQYSALIYNALCTL